MGRFGRIPAPQAVDCTEAAMAGTSDGGKTYRSWDPEAYREQAHRPAVVLPEDDLVFFMLETVARLDLSKIYDYYERETRGAPPFDPRMMVTLLLYSYCVGVFSSRRIAAACERNLAFLAIVGLDRPDFRTISEFRRVHLDVLAELFVQVLRLAAELGMVRLGNVAIDGSKFKANASRHKAMSYGYMEKEVERLRGEIATLLARAEAVDAEQDAAMGSRRGDELPLELQRRQDRLDRIEEAMKRLEAEAQARAQEEQREREEKAREQGREPRGKVPDESPAPKSQTNFTDPDAKIMKTSNKGWDYCGNAQVSVDGEQQIILAAEVTMEANDKRQAVPMAEKTLENLQAAGIAPPRDDQGKPVPIPMTADSGYFSEGAVEQLEGRESDPPLDPHIAVGRQKHHPPVPAEAEGPPPEGASTKERMAHKLRTKAGRACYAQRKAIVEPVFGQIKGVRGFRQFLLRSLPKIRAEWTLVCLTHNLLKIWRYRCALS